MTLAFSAPERLERDSSQQHRSIHVCFKSACCERLRAYFQTHDPWGFTILKDAITANGHTYTEFTPADLATVNFSDYRVVIL